MNNKHWRNNKMLDFKNIKGKAEKSGPPRIKFTDGVNRFRMVGGVMPMYVYWIPLADGSGKVPIECLAFDRNQEKFTNLTKDWVRHYFPEEKCSWSYKGLAIDRTDGQIKAVDHKKKLLQTIISFAESQGDPTDPDTGWDVVVNRVKTGPHTFNVEYNLEFGQIKKSPLTDEEKKMVAEFPSLEDYFQLPNPEDQKRFLEEKCAIPDVGEPVEEEGDLPEEFNKDEDVPF